VLDVNTIKDVSKLQKELNAAWNTVVEWWNREKVNLLVLLCGIFVTFLVAALTSWIFKRFVMKMFAAKTETVVDDMLGEAVEPPFKSFIYVLGISLSAMPILISFPSSIFNSVIRIALAGMAASIAWGVFRLIRVLDHGLHALAQRTDNNLDDLIVNLIRKTLKVTLIVLSVLFIGQSILGLNITTLLAGAGVLGLGIAFAAKDTIANFFGSLMIILDKPFKVGDRIIVDGIDGIVEHVGFRSTRMRTLTGHLVTMPNSKMADNAVENIAARPFIKFISNITLVYETPAEKVERAVEVLHEILDDHEGLNEEKPPMIVFNAFNDWSLNIMVIVWYHPGDWAMAQAWNHRNNLEILKRFNEEGLEFAFPTNTTYLAGDPTRQLVVNQTK
jgi:MscS family membrane protein